MFYLPLTTGWQCGAKYANLLDARVHTHLTTKSQVLDSSVHNTRASYMLECNFTLGLSTAVTSDGRRAAAISKSSEGNEDRGMRAWWRRSGRVKKKTKQWDRHRERDVGGFKQGVKDGLLWEPVWAFVASEEPNRQWPSVETLTLGSSCSAPGLDRIPESPNMQDSHKSLCLTHTHTYTHIAAAAATTGCWEHSGTKRPYTHTHTQTYIHCAADVHMLMRC